MENDHSVPCCADLVAQKAQGAEMHQLRLPVFSVFAVHLAFVLWFVHKHRLLSRGSRVPHRCGRTAAEHREFLTRHVEEDFMVHAFDGWHDVR
jgi:hypothetical protein